jgi:hypothetical protein
MAVPGAPCAKRGALPSRRLIVSASTVSLEVRSVENGLADALTMLKAMALRACRSPSSKIGTPMQTMPLAVSSSSAEYPRSRVTASSASRLSRSGLDARAALSEVAFVISCFTLDSLNVDRIAFPVAVDQAGSRMPI